MAGDEVSLGPPSGLSRFDEIRDVAAGRCLAVFLDYDGTLTPIVSHPDLAKLSDGTRKAVQELAARCTVAIVSGRDLEDVRRHVAIRSVFYAGSHGLEASGPGGWYTEYEGAVRLLPALDSAERELAGLVPSVVGAWLERKRFAIAVHYRNVADADVSTLDRMVAQVALNYEGLLRRAPGKKVYELRPQVECNKGSFVNLLLERLGLSAGGLPIYIGDDATDEDGFLAVAGEGIGIVVGEAPEVTAARYSLKDSGEVLRFLDALTASID